MGDVKDILLGNIPGGESSSLKNEQLPAHPLPKYGGDKLSRKPSKKPVGMSREVYALIGNEDGLLPGLVPTRTVSSFKEKRGASSKWIWTEFHNSARTDGVQFSHWQKVGMDVPDYPYSKFNIKLDLLCFNESEYHSYLEDPNWTFQSSEKLLNLCHKYDLRWPVIFDRFTGSSDTVVPVEQLMARYYACVKVLCIDHPSAERQGRVFHPFATGGGPEHFNFEYEQKRRLQLELQFKKTREEEQEEEALKEQLKQLDQQLRHLRKQSSKEGDGGKGDDYGAWVQAKEQLDATKPHPRPREPYLQSQRIPLNVAAPAPKPIKGGVATNLGPQVSKGMMRKVTTMLLELGVVDKPLPTRRNADLLDVLKQDIVALLTLNKIKSQKKHEYDQLLAQMPTKIKNLAVLNDLPVMSIPEIPLQQTPKKNIKASTIQRNQKGGQKRPASKTPPSKNKKTKKS